MVNDWLPTRGSWLPQIAIRKLIIHSLACHESALSVPALQDDESSHRVADHPPPGASERQGDGETAGLLPPAHQQLPARPQEQPAGPLRQPAAVGDAQGAQDGPPRCVTGPSLAQQSMWLVRYREPDGMTVIVWVQSGCGCGSSRASSICLPSRPGKWRPSRRRQPPSSRRAARSGYATSSPSPAKNGRTRCSDCSPALPFEQICGTPITVPFRCCHFHRGVLCFGKYLGAQVFTNCRFRAVCARSWQGIVCDLAMSWQGIACNLARSAQAILSNTVRFALMINPF